MTDLVGIRDETITSENVLLDRKLRLLAKIENHCNVLFDLSSTLLDVLPEKEPSLEPFEVWNKVRQKTDPQSYLALIKAGEKSARNFSLKSDRVNSFDALREKVQTTSADVINTQFLLGK